MKIARPILILALVVAAVALAFPVFDLGTRLGLVAQEKQGLELYGNVDIRQVELGFRVGGRVAAMHAEEGDSVDAGDELANLDEQSYWDEVRLAEAEVAMAMANLQKLEAGTRPEEIAQAEALVAEREAALVNAQHKFQRQARLAENEFASRRTYDEAKALLEEAKARFVSAKKALDLAEAGFRSEDKAAARASLEAAKARLAAVETALVDTSLKAPADGVILSRIREPGAIVAPGETVYTLSLQKPIWVRAYVPEPALDRLRPGQEVQVVSDGRPDQPYRGHVGFISPVAEFTPKTVETPELRTALVYRFRVVVEGDAAELRQGMPVTVRIPPPTGGSVGQKDG